MRMKYTLDLDAPLYLECGQTNSSANTHNE